MALRDPCSHANIDQIITKSLHLDLTACFESKELSGYARLHLQATQDGVDKVVLDTRNLNIGAVATADGICFPYELSGEDALGSALTITLNEPLAKGAELQLRVDYTTSPEAAGIQWLEPVQTEGKQHPYLFTQFQAIHCRSGVPCQDTPAVKIPYTAAMTVPKPLTALMSALSTDSTSNEDGTTTFRFSQPVPIPTYLIAFVIGHLESREIGPRSRVWAEPGVVEKAEYEFSQDTETYLKIAEDLLIPYEWGRYDMVCLPGSFPYGGMENPCLTFVTPTLLAGDRSLTNVVAHEITHSWTGNLVTNRTWEHFWLNEGFTVFVERKILGRMYGEPFRQFEFINGWKSLKDSVDLYGVEHNFTTLLPKLDGIDPDDAFSSVPYERGSEFLFYLEQHVGAALFEPFLRQWINDNKYGTVTTDLFRDFFQSYFQDKVSAEVLKSIDWEGWLYKPGMPPVDLLGSFDDSLAAKTKQLAHQWLSDPATTGSKDDFSSSDLTVDFLNRLELGGTKGVLSKELLERLDASYSFTASRNAEIRMQWYTLCLLSGYEPIFPHVVQFLSEQGRMKYVRPLYRMLYNSSAAGKELALTTFDRLKDTYHNIAKKMIQSDLNKLQEQSH